MPDLKADVSTVLNVYERCQANHCLPFPGGLLEQPEWLMGLFDVIEAEKAGYQRETRERARDEAAQTQLKADMESRSKRGN